METMMVNRKAFSLIGQIQLLAQQLEREIKAATPCVSMVERGTVMLPGEGVQVRLNPVEMTLYRLFLAHPQGLRADELLRHWTQLCSIYKEESFYDDPSLREATMEALCGESKLVFYSTVSRIKKKFVCALDPWQADAYIIKRDASGVYRTHARVLQEELA